MTFTRSFPVVALFALACLSFAPSGGALPRQVAHPDDPIQTAPARIKRETKEFIPWSWERPLTWDDFQGPVKRNGDAVATTNTSLGIDFRVSGGKFQYFITCKFSKLKSWGLTKTEYILAHEQAHFDITELFARRLHRELAAYKYNRRTWEKEINGIYQKVVREKEAFQEAYDGETDHSRRKKRQAEWLDRIDQLLEETEPWGAYP